MKNILITGISGSLGNELQRHFKDKKYNVFSTSSSKTANIFLDLTKIQNLKNAKKFIFANEITHLINNAGIYQNKNFTDLTDNEIQEIVNVNLISPIILSKYLYQYLLTTNKEGMIININSVAAKQPHYSEAVYAATKSGLGSFGTALSTNQKVSKIRILDCYLGAFKSKITSNREGFNNLIDSAEIAETICNLITTNSKGTVTSFEYRGK